MKRMLSGIINNGVLSILFTGTILISLFSCCNNPVEDAKKRNILFYIGADNNGLDNGNEGDEPRQKINQICAGWQPGKGEMLIYTDQTNKGAYLLRVNETKGADGLYGLDTVMVFGKENSAGSGVLSRVINQVVQTYPADSYGMIFFSHASGWMPYDMLSKPRSLVIDKGEETKYEMEYYDFAAAIPDKQFDFIIFEACLIADVMSMYELRNKAEYILASSAEIVVPGFVRTNTYKNEIMRLYDTRSDLKYIVTSFAKSYYDGIASIPENSIFCSTTLSVLKMDEMANLASVTKTLLKGKIIDETNLLVDSIQHFDRPYTGTFGWQHNSRYFDFAHTMEKLVSASDYKAFNDQMEKTVVWKASTKRFLLGDYQNGLPDYDDYDGFFIVRHSGLTTYIKQDVYPELNLAYKNSSWHKAIY